MAMSHDIAIADNAKSMMEFNDCDDIIQARHVNDDIIKIVEFHCRSCIVDDIVA